jgi:dephospho-CoA kinase
VIIGLTGGIASGKSTALGYFTQFGASVVNADIVAHTMYKQDRDLYDEMVAVFGEHVYYPSTLELNVPYLSNLVFSDQSKMQQLVGLVCPRITSRLRQVVSMHKKTTPDRTLVIEAAMLFEYGLENSGLFDTIVTIAAPRADRIRRLMSRNGMTEAVAVMRIESQMPQDEKIRRSDYVICNHGTADALKRAVQEFVERKLNVCDISGVI